MVEVDDLPALADRLQAANVAFISPRVVEVRGAPWSKGLMVKDPDGHAVLLVQP